MIVPHLPPASVLDVVLVILDVLKGLSKTDSPSVVSFLVSVLRPLILTAKFFSSSLVSSIFPILASSTKTLNSDELDELLLQVLKGASTCSGAVQPAGGPERKISPSSVGSLSDVASTLLSRSLQSKYLHYSRPLFKSLVGFRLSEKCSLTHGISREEVEQLLVYCLSLPLHNNRLAIVVALLEKECIDDVSTLLFLPVLELLEHCSKTEEKDMEAVVAVVQQLLFAYKKEVSQGVCVCVCMCVCVCVHVHAIAYVCL